MDVQGDAVVGVGVGDLAELLPYFDLDAELLAELAAKARGD